MKDDANRKSDSDENSVLRLHSKITSANAGSSGRAFRVFRLHIVQTARNDSPANID